MEWIKLNKDNPKKQLKPYLNTLIYIAVKDIETKEKGVTTDIWDGDTFEDYSVNEVEYFAPFEMPEYPEEDN